MNKKQKADAPAAGDAESFEQHLAELEQLVHKLENGQLGLSESLKCFEAGLAHLRACQCRLREAEERVSLVLSVDAEGNAQTRDLPLDARPAASAGESRVKKRSAKLLDENEGELF
jgi:exodeoxyribonuclease VII small subunit